MKAIAIMKGESDVTGIVTFTQNQGQVTKVDATFRNLPAGKHGFHIHEFGDVTNGCISAGAHFNPFGHDHGGPGMSQRHVGDMGNVMSTGESETYFTIQDPSIQLQGAHSIVGRSVVLHRDEDDLGLGDHEDSKTTGHSGPRLACGIIGIAQ